MAETQGTRITAFLPQLKTSSALGFGRVRDSRPILLDG